LGGKCQQVGVPASRWSCGRRGRRLGQPSYIERDIGDPSRRGPSRVGQKERRERRRSNERRGESRKEIEGERETKGERHASYHGR